MPATLKPDDALIVVDMQNDFLPGGTLSVPQGGVIIPLINRLLAIFPLRVFTRDWHPAGHVSFSSEPAFVDKSWPQHCVQNTWGAQFTPSIKLSPSDKIISKGTDPNLEAYSAFQGTDLDDYLKLKSIRRLFIAGLATDYCVLHTALDARALGYDTYVIRDGVKGVNVPEGTEAQALDQMAAAGVKLVPGRELGGL